MTDPVGIGIGAITGALGQVIEVVQDAHARAGAGGAFTLDTGAFRAAYRDFYAAYEEVKGTRERVQSQAMAVGSAATSAQISGIGQAAYTAGRATGDESLPSLVAEIATTEAKMARYLVAMHDAFVAYTRGDSSGMQALVSTQGQ